MNHFIFGSSIYASIIVIIILYKISNHQVWNGIITHLWNMFYHFALFSVKWNGLLRKCNKIIENKLNLSITIETQNTMHMMFGITLQMIKASILQDLHSLSLSSSLSLAHFHGYTRTIFVHLIKIMMVKFWTRAAYTLHPPFVLNYHSPFH